MVAEHMVYGEACKALRGNGVVCWDKLAGFGEGVNDD
jgi:hypothetical protein